MSSRKTNTNFTCAYRVVLVHPWGTLYKGPYQTYAAAKAQLTRETTGWHANTGKTGWIEQTPDDAWEQV